MSWGSSYAWLLRDFIRDEINSVCPSVCLSRWWSVLKRQKIGSRFLFHMIALFRHYATTSVCVGNDAFWFRLLFTAIYPEYTKCVVNFLAWLYCLLLTVYCLAGATCVDQAQNILILCDPLYELKQSHLEIDCVVTSLVGWSLVGRHPRALWPDSAS